jgi:NAD(P)-dependent dehydrogenase (short-subunit alcohol dehydrogenase family)
LNQPGIRRTPKEEKMSLLKEKVAVIYGAGGATGGAVARAFASEGAKLFLTGRKLAPVEAVAKDVGSAGGSAEAAEVNALDEQGVDEHLRSVIDKAGGCPTGRAGRRAVLPADHGLRRVVLFDRTPGGPADGRQ